MWSPPNAISSRNYNCIGAFDVPEWDSILDIDILMETRKGVAISYSFSQAVVNF